MGHNGSQPPRHPTLISPLQCIPRKGLLQEGKSKAGDHLKFWLRDGLLILRWLLTGDSRGSSTSSLLKEHIILRKGHCQWEI